MEEETLCSIFFSNFLLFSNSFSFPFAFLPGGGWKFVRNRSINLPDLLSNRVKLSARHCHTHKKQTVLGPSDIHDGLNKGWYKRHDDDERGHGMVSFLYFHLLLSLQLKLTFSRYYQLKRMEWNYTQFIQIFNSPLASKGDILIAWYHFCSPRATRLSEMSNPAQQRSCKDPTAPAKLQCISTHPIISCKRILVSIVSNLTWGQINKPLTSVIYNCSLVLESENNSCTCKLH